MCCVILWQNVRNNDLVFSTGMFLFNKNGCYVLCRRRKIYLKVNVAQYIGNHAYSERKTTFSLRFPSIRRTLKSFCLPIPNLFNLIFA